MKKYLVLLVLLTGCGGVNGAQPTCSSGQLLGSDNECYSCNYGTPEYQGSEFGYCGAVSAGGVACCTTAYNFGNITCYPNQPWLCTDALCHTVDIGACIYRP